MQPNPLDALVLATNSILLPSENAGNHAQRSYRITPAHVRELFVRFMESDIKHTIAEGARLFDIKEGTARMIWNTYNTTGRIYPKPMGGARNIKITPIITYFIRDVIEERPDTTLSQLRTNIMSKFGVTVATSTIAAVLTKIGFTFKLIRNIPESRNIPATILARNVFSRDMLQNPPNNRRNLIYLDEAGFNLHLRRRQGRAMRGSRALLTVPNSRGRNISVAAAMSEDGFLHHKVRLGAYNAVFFIEFLGELFQKLQQMGRHGCWLVLDNVRFHHTPAVSSFVQENNHVLKFLPAYSPMLNPIESLFSKWKSLLRTTNVAFDQQVLLNNMNATMNLITVDDCLGWIRETNRNLALCMDNHQF
jgi:transposase